MGPVIAARTTGAQAAPLSALTQSTVALTILINAPGLLVLGGFGFALWLGWPPGAHGALLTLPAAGVAVAIRASLRANERASSSKLPAPAVAYHHLVCGNVTNGVTVGVSEVVL